MQVAVTLHIKRGEGKEREVKITCTQIQTKSSVLCIVTGVAEASISEQLRSHAGVSHCERAKEAL